MTVNKFPVAQQVRTLWQAISEADLFPGIDARSEERLEVEHKQSNA
jgi:hypothetical protein